MVEPGHEGYLQRDVPLDATKPLMIKIEQLAE